MKRDELDRRDFVKTGTAFAVAAGLAAGCSSAQEEPAAPIAARYQMKLFDCDVIVGRRNVITADSFWETGKILEAMARFEITQALVYHAASEEVDPQRGNEWVGEEAAEAGAMRPSWVLSPAIRGEWPEPGQIVESLIGSGARAARLFPHAQFFPLSVFMLDDLLAGAGAAPSTPARTRGHDPHLERPHGLAWAGGNLHRFPRPPGGGHASRPACYTPPVPDAGETAKLSLPAQRDELQFPGYRGRCIPFWIVPDHFWVHDARYQPGYSVDPDCLCRRDG